MIFHHSTVNFYTKLNLQGVATTSVNDMINAHVLRLVELFRSFFQMLGACTKLDKVS